MPMSDYPDRRPGQPEWLVRSVNTHCECGGKGLDDPKACGACRVYHDVLADIAALPDPAAHAPLTLRVERDELAAQLEEANAEAVAFYDVAQAKVDSLEAAHAALEAERDAAESGIRSLRDDYDRVVRERNDAREALDEREAAHAALEADRDQRVTDLRNLAMAFGCDPDTPAVEVCPELLPCPFCGGPCGGWAHLPDEMWHAPRQGETCLIATPIKPLLATREAWNTRTPDPAAHAALEAEVATRKRDAKH